LGRGLRDGVFFEGVAADEVAGYYSSLAAASVFEADDHHSVATQTATPTAHSVLGADPTCGDKFVVACSADVVVALVAFWAMIACMGRGDRVCADIANGSEC
jgi:hypothetical protein